MKKFLIIATTVLLAACGSGIEGTYKDAYGISSYTFKSGKVTIAAKGFEQEMDYEVEDNKVKLIAPQGALVMNLLEDGSITGPGGIKLTKQ